MGMEETATAGERFHVAIFEDLDAAREEYKRLFEGHGVKLKFFDTATVDSETREALTSFAPHLLIVDLVLGQSRLDGFRLLKELHQTASIRDKPVIVCSKLVSDAAEPSLDKRRALETPGVVAALPKTPEYPSADDFLRHAASPAGSFQPQPLVR